MLIFYDISVGGVCFRRAGSPRLKTLQETMRRYWIVMLFLMQTLMEVSGCRWTVIWFDPVKALWGRRVDVKHEVQVKHPLYRCSGTAVSNLCCERVD